MQTDINIHYSQDLPINVDTPFSAIKEAMTFIYFAIMFIAFVIVTFEVKLFFDIDIPFIDIPFDEMYVKFFK